MDCIDNCLEWYTGEKVATISFSQKKWITRIKKLARDHPKDICEFIENEDGSITAHIPATWIKINPPRKSRELSEEDKLTMAARLAEGKRKKNCN